MVELGALRRVFDVIGRLDPQAFEGSAAALGQAPQPRPATIGGANVEVVRVDQVAGVGQALQPRRGVGARGGGEAQPGDLLGRQVVVAPDRGEDSAGGLIGERVQGVPLQ